MKRNRTFGALWGAATFGLLLVAWYGITAGGFISDFFLPSPMAVYKALINLFTQGNLWRHIGVSISRISIGFVLAVITAIPIGIIISLHKKSRAAIEPLIDFVRYTPVPAFIPLLILWFGIGETEKAVVIFASVFFQLVPMTVNSVSLTPKELIITAETLGATKWQIISRVLFSYSKPAIWNDLRICMGWAWSVLLIAELVGSSAGLGYVILQAQRLLQTPQVISAILVIGTLGILTDWIFREAGKLMFPWNIKNQEDHA